MKNQNRRLKNGNKLLQSGDGKNERELMHEFNRYYHRPDTAYDRTIQCRISGFWLGH